VSFDAITPCVASQRVFVVVAVATVCFVIDLVRNFWIHLIVLTSEFSHDENVYSVAFIYVSLTICSWRVI
jgi:hypothetical protein